MHFRKHSADLVGRHAALSPSQYHWINYSEEKMARRFATAQAAARGDRLHKLAHDLIREREKLPRSKKTLNMYVNDAIGFKMTPEVMLYYSENFFGTADVIAFRQNKLYIFDLKTGVSPTSVHQLECYAALFCLEYEMNPFEIGIELRIYQNNEIETWDADPDTIMHIMEKGKLFDKLIRAWQAEEELA